MKKVRIFRTRENERSRRKGRTVARAEGEDMNVFIVKVDLAIQQLVRGAPGMRDRVGVRALS